MTQQTEHRMISPVGSRSVGLTASLAGWRTPLLVVLLLGYSLFLIGQRGLWKPDEGRYTCVALNMLERGSWLYPELHDEKPHYTKPPLTYWAIASSIAVFGRSEWSARLPGALAFAGTVLLLAGIGRRLVPRLPWLPALIYATFPFPYIAATLVTTDTLLTGFETLAMFAFIEWLYRSGEPRRLRWLLLMWLAFGLAFMTKGPPGLLPLAAAVVFVGWRRGGREQLRMLDLRGVLLFAVVGLWWYIVVIVSRPTLLEYFFGEEVVGRVAGLHGRNGQWYGPFKAYLPVLTAGALPWSWVLFREATRWWCTRRAAQGAGGWRRWVPVATSNAGRLLLLWIGLPMVVFCVAKSRLPLYVLPVMVPLALVLALQVEGDLLRWWKHHRQTMQWAMAGWMVFMLGTRVIGGCVENDKDSRLLAHAIEKKVKEPVSEVVFVNDVPDYGLRFYLDAEVERVNFREGGGDESLVTELTEYEVGRLFIVDDSEDGKLQRVKCPHGAHWERMGKYEDARFYMLQPVPRDEAVPPSDAAPQPATPVPAS